MYDDLAGSSHARGFSGHLRALRQGTVTTGLLKIAGIGAAGLASASLAGGRGRSSLADQFVAGAVIACSANLTNLLDLRPGRAAKAVLLVGAPLSLVPGASGIVAAATTGAATGVIREDLAEEIMLGDAGANALGALVGLGAVLCSGRRGRLALLAGLVALNAASERVSFSRVIEGNTWLHRLDSLGRRP
jgi:UDP-N-acetylmuramyl pentapeptide phosphotransferase/UDP-N-acetylglucosamine-1-phosphate transferase